MIPLTNTQVSLIEADLLMETGIVLGAFEDFKQDNDDAERRAMMRQSEESKALEAQLATPPVTERK